MTGIDAGPSATDSTRTGTSTSMPAVLRPALRARPTGASLRGVPRPACAWARRVLPVLVAACLVAGCDLPGSQQAGGPAASPAPSVTTSEPQETGPQETGPTGADPDGLPLPAGPDGAPLPPAGEVPLSPTGGPGQAAPASYAAPPGARHLGSFRGSARQGTCAFQSARSAIGEAGVICPVPAQSWSLPRYSTDMRGRPCNSYALHLVVTSTSSGLLCLEGDIGMAQDTLDVGQTATNGEFACTVTSEATITCWSTTSGVSFAFSRDGWMTGTTGPIPESAHTW
ncbi:hypothetical protein C3V41_01565 [Actinomyces sp. oral taxon 897]|nr:hypothetical protein C3V41_01565 [Actinomyces sp. oral taxon 897]